MAPLAPEIEIEFWRSINDSDPEEFRLYLERFPEGTYADLARLRIAKLAAPADRRPAGDQASLVRRDARHDRGRDHTMPPRRLSASEARRAQEAEAQRRTAAEREVMRKAEEGWKATEAWCRAEVEQLARLFAKSQPVQFANQNEQAGPAEQAGQDELVQIEREELVPPVTEAKQTRREKASEVNAPARQAAHPVASPVTQERLLAMALIARASAEAPRLGVSSYKTLPFLVGFGLALFVALVAAGILLQPETAPRLIPVTQPPVVTAAPATPSGPPDDVVEPTRPGPEAPAPTAALNVPDNGKNVGPVPPPARPGPVDAETIRHARARDTKAAGGQNVPVHQEAGENTAPPRLPPGPDAKWSQIDQRAKEPARPTGPQVPTATPGGTLLPGADTGGDSRPAPEVPDRTRDAVDFGNIYGRRSRVVTPGYAEQFRWPGTKPNAVEAPAPDPTATPRAAARPTEAETAREREARKTDLAATEKRQKMEGYIETARRAEAKGDNRRAFIMYGMAFVSGNDSDAPRSIRETGGRAARAMGDMFGRAGNRAEQLKWYEKAKAMGAEVPLPGKPQH
jgi:hypothetical protein